MSEQGVTALLERLETDQGLLERLQAAPTPEAKRRIVQEAGFDVERSDLPSLRAKAGLQELSDEDLRKVAGGGQTTTAASIASGTAVSMATVSVAAAALA